MEQHPTHTFAWQPLTFRGVAAFAYASLSRLLIVQFVVVALAAASVIVLFEAGWNRSIERAIDQLPEHGEIRDGELYWTNAAPARFGEGSFISFIMDPDHTGGVGQNADVDCLLTRRDLRVHSIFGYVSVRYPPQWTIPLRRSALKSWWGAWHDAVLVSFAVSVAVGVSLSWWLLATLYVAPVRCLAFYADRALTWTGAWRLASAGLLTGALLMSVAILAYTFHWLTLLQLLAASAAHFVIGWIFVVGGILRLRTLATDGGVRPKNPFNPAEKE